jgi:fibronectin type 3 domain-containing protein
MTGFHQSQVVLLSICMMALAACSSDLSEPEPFDASTFPDAPVNLRIQIGSNKIALFWSHSKPAAVASYNVYRKSVTDSAFSLVGSTEDTTYIDSGLPNGVENQYAVTAVSTTSGRESERRMASATPGLYSIVIEGGRSAVNTRQVVVNVTAPAQTRLMLVTNDSSRFSSAYWQAFQASFPWQLEDNDGKKTVYVIFENEIGQHSSVVQDDIGLDTQANIEYLTHDAEDRIVSGGSTIKVQMKTGEYTGAAQVFLGDGQINNSLSLVSGELYEWGGELFIPENTNLFDANLIGQYVDGVGNITQFVARKRINVNSPPFDVTVFEPEVDVATAALRLSWTAARDADFSKYEVRRSDEAFVHQGSSLIATIREPNTNQLIDSNVVPEKTYYYRVYVVDGLGLRSESNMVSGTTGENVAPTPVILAQPTQGATATLRLSWTANADADFDSYRIYRSTVSPVDTTQVPIQIIGQQATTTFDSAGLAGTTYYYRVFVFDKFGASAGSNQVSGRLN